MKSSLMDTISNLQPENLLIDILRTSNKNDTCEISKDEAQPAVRLIDLGSARRLAQPFQFTSNADVSTSVSNDTSLCASDPITSIKEILLLKVLPDQPPLLLGSPEFMAPEVLSKKDVGVQADYWSIGILIYVLVRLVRAICTRFSCCDHTKVYL